jgi:hypothetical protein
MTDEHNHAKFLRLKNGDDLVAECYEYEDDNGTYYTIINPLKAMYVPSGSGYLQVAFTPWVYPRICDMQEFNILASEVLLVQDVSDYMDEYYWSSLENYLNDKREEPTEPEELEGYEERSKEEVNRLKEILEGLGIGDKKVYH